MKIAGEWAYPLTLRQAAVFGDADATDFLGGHPFPVDKETVREAMRARYDEPVLVFSGEDICYISRWGGRPIGDRVIACNAITCDPDRDKIWEWAHA